MSTKKNSRDIWVCLVTKDNFNGVRRTFESLFSQIATFQKKEIKVLVIDKSQNHLLKEWLISRADHIPQEYLYIDSGVLEALEKKYLWLYQQLKYDLTKDSVQRGRLQLMMAIYEHRETIRDSILWQIDDDILFQQLKYKDGVVCVSSDRDYFSELHQYHSLFSDVDAAIGLCSYAPPIPILLYAEKQLSDLIHGAVPDMRSLPNGSSDEWYHDLIPLGQSSLIATTPSLHGVNNWLEACLRGIPVTRPVALREEFIDTDPRSSVLRGANFAIFNPKLAWALPHISFSYQGIIGRRSDMIHAWMLTQIGFNIKTMELSLFHNRNFPTVDLTRLGREYLADLIGAVAFRFLAGNSDDARERFEQHKAHLNRLEQLSTSLSAMDSGRLAFRLHLQVLELKNEVGRWDWQDIEAALVRFSYKVNHWLEKVPILS